MNYLQDPLYFAAFAGLCVAFILIYLKLEPYIAHHRWIKWTLDLTITLSMISLAVSLIIGVPWKLQLTWDALLHNLFMARANGQADSSHAVAYLTVPAIYFLAQRRWSDTWHSFLFVAYLMLLYDRIWYVFYLARYSGMLSLADEFWPNMTFLLLFLSVAGVYWRRYGYDRRMLVMLLPQLLYYMAWYSMGFHVSVSNSHSLANIYRVTEYWDDLGTNMMEVAGSFLALATAAIYLHVYKPAGSQTEGEAET